MTRMMKIMKKEGKTRVILKIITQCVDDGRGISYFLRALLCHCLGSLSSPNIIKVYGMVLN